MYARRSAPSTPRWSIAGNVPRLASAARRNAVAWRRESWLAAAKRGARICQPTRRAQRALAGEPKDPNGACQDDGGDDGADDEIREVRTRPGDKRAGRDDPDVGNYVIR